MTVAAAAAIEVDATVIAGRGSRGRIFVPVALLLVLFASISLFMTRQSLLYSVESRVSAQLGDAVARFREEVDETAVPRDAELRRAVEALGARSASDVELALYSDGRRAATTAGFVDALGATGGDVLSSAERDWAELTTSERGAVTAADGRVDYLAVPILAGDEIDGVLVATVDASASRTVVGRTVWVVAAALAIALMVGLLAAWWLAGRLSRGLQPGPVAGPLPTGDTAPVVAATSAADDRVPAAAAAGTPLSGTTQSGASTTAAPAGPATQAPSRPAATSRPAAPRARRRGRRGGPAIHRVPVELNRVTLGVYSHAQRLADRNWVLDVPSDERVRVDPDVVVAAAARLTEQAARTTTPGDTIIVGADAGDDGTARVHVTTIVRDDRFARADAQRRFDLLLATHTEEGMRAVGDLRAAADGHGGRLEVTCVGDTGVRVDLVLPPA